MAEELISVASAAERLGLSPASVRNHVASGALAGHRGITDVRATVDVDVLAQARPQRTLERLREALHALGVEQEAPDLDGYAYRFVRGHEIIDVLAPEGIGPPAHARDRTTGDRDPGRLPGAQQVQRMSSSWSNARSSGSGARSGRYSSRLAR